MLNGWDVAGFLVLLGLIVWHASRVRPGADAFLVADRSVTLFPLTATLVMTEFNTSTLLAFSAVGYSAGPMALALPLVFLIGLGFYTVTVARAWKRFDRLSVAELFSVRYSRGLGRLAAVFLVDDILNRLILANVPVAGLAFALLAGFHWPRATTAGAWASMIVGIGWGAGAFLLVGEEGGYTWDWAIYGIPLIFATGILESLATPASRRVPAPAG